MKQLSLLLLLCFFGILVFGCQQATPPKTETGIEGQIYEIGGPAFDEGGTPPPLQEVRTIVVSDSNRVTLQEFTTDSLGAFRIALQAGTYFLLVKDTTFLQGQNGPFVIQAGHVSSVNLYHDNGIR